MNRFLDSYPHKGLQTSLRPAVHVVETKPWIIPSDYLLDFRPQSPELVKHSWGESLTRQCTAATIFTWWSG